MLIDNPLKRVQVDCLIAFAHSRIAGIAGKEQQGVNIFQNEDVIKVTNEIGHELEDLLKDLATVELINQKISNKNNIGLANMYYHHYTKLLDLLDSAIPKDGPSAGITMTTALVSAFTNRKVRKHLAMTGEITLRGKVLPVGGIKEKILAAKRAGITDIILCSDNQKDIDEIKPIYLKGLKFHYVNDIMEVIDFALLKK